MTDEEIIRHEAAEFSKHKFRRLKGFSADVRMNEIKQELLKFYAHEHKAIFLDEVQTELLTGLQEHRDDAHGGKPGKECGVEISAEKLLFFIRQEISTYPTVANRKTVSNPKHYRNKVFVSYSHFDKEYLKDIKRHFKPFLHQIDFWHDERILPGQTWKEEIKKAIDETKVAILLISTDFLGSEFIATDELPPLLELAENDGATVLILILKPVLFERFPKLNKYQTMNNPKNPVINLDESEREELYVNLVNQTMRVLGV